MPRLTPSQERLQDDIRGLIKGEVFCDEITRHTYSTDAGILRVYPRGVVRPKNTKDVVACVHYAAENNIPIHLRGSGTGTSGESLGEGLVLDFSRFMNRWEYAGTDGNNSDGVSVQPGISLQRLNNVLSEPHQRLFAPVCGFVYSTTLGSVLSRNGAGRRFLQYGLPSDFVQELEVVLANGNILTLNRETLPLAIEVPDSGVFRPNSSVPGKPHSIKQGIALARGITYGQEHRVADEVYKVLSSVGNDTIKINANIAGDFVTSHNTRLGQKNLSSPFRYGYCYDNVLLGEERRLVDIARLITGSEGTLGVIVKAKIRTVPLPNRKAGAVLFFNSIERAVQSLEWVLQQRLAMCELIDRRLLALMSEAEPQFRHLLPVEAEAVLLIELNAGDIAAPEPEESVRQQLRQLIDGIQHRERLCFHSLRVDSPEDFGHFDRFLEQSEYILFQMRGTARPLPLFDDIAVPVTKIKEFIPELLAVFQRNEVTVSISGHIGQGQLRVFPLLNPQQENLNAVLFRLIEEVYALTEKFGGTVSSDSGAGLLKSPYLVQHTPELLPVFREIKEVFDSDYLLSPGNIIPRTSQWSVLQQNQLTDNAVLEKKEKPENTPQVALLERQLRWEPQTVSEIAHRCNGCGKCYQNDKHSRFCPLLRSERKEENSPRTKVHFVQGILNEKLNLETLAQEQAKELADSCILCRSCRTECPAEIDIPQLVFRIKSSYIAAHGLSLDDLFWSHLDSVLDWATAIAFPVNGIAKNRFSRWLLEKILQIPQERQLPRLAKISFLNRIRFHNFLTRSSIPGSSLQQDKVALFIDTYFNHFETELADTAVRILEEHGLHVLVPQRQRASGLIPIALGNQNEAELLAKRNTAVFADLIRQGYIVVTLEPASASCLVQDYPWLIEGEDAALLSAHTVDFCTFLWRHRQNGLWKREFQPVPKQVAYHAPCRSITEASSRVVPLPPAEKLLRLIPELKVRRIEQGCCGAPGVFGFKRKSYRQSVKIGMGLFRELRSVDIEYGVSDCNACRLQMEHGSKKKALHPIHLFAEAWGLR